MPLQISDLSDAVLHTHYAVRGPIVARAQELEHLGREIIYCNIGNPQALGQKPLTYVRDVLAAARTILGQSKYGLGAYSESKGMRFVRKAIADFIAARDSTGGVMQTSNPEHIYLTDGASKGVQAALRLLIASHKDGILIPIPQYPLYSATITLYGGRQIGYYLDEDSGWSLNEQMLEEAMHEAIKEGIRARAIVVINPGNPTGAVLTEENIEMVIRFAKRHNLAILADEVYQENIYKPGARFLSFAHVMTKLSEHEVSLFSFHSTSKGFFGECGPSRPGDDLPYGQSAETRRSELQTLRRRAEPYPLGARTARKNPRRRPQPNPRHPLPAYPGSNVCLSFDFVARRQNR